MKKLLHISFIIVANAVFIFTAMAQVKSISQKVDLEPDEFDVMIGYSSTNTR